MHITKIKKLLYSNNFEFYYFQKVDSTMKLAKKKLNNRNLCVLADEQLNGLGRRGNKWISKKGNLYLSYLINYDLSIQNHFIYNAAITNSVCELIDSCCNVTSSIKWPNDILVNKSKISGIMSELYKKNKQTFIIIGVGINIESSPKITNYSTTYTKIFNKHCDRNYIAYKLTEYFINQYKNILSKKYENIILLYKNKLLNLGESIKIKEDNNKISSFIFEDINIDGSILANIDGVRKNIYSGRIQSDND